MKKNNRVIAILLSLALVFLLVACGDNDSTEPQQSEEGIPREGDIIEATDYSDENNWATIGDGSMAVDVFVLYPTAYIPDEEGDGKIADINDETMREGADGFIEQKASAFAVGNMYAPYYRQTDATWALSLPESEQDAYLGGVPKTDVLAAFDYYIENYNEGRPFILASHSQGSDMMKRLLFDYMKDNQEVYDRMIAAYLIGISITQDELDEYPYLKFAESADDTGVIVSYNTASPDVDVTTIATWDEGGVVINPISWTRDETEAPATDNLGSRVNTEDGIEQAMDLANAQVDLSKQVLICSSIPENEVENYSIKSMPELFPIGSYHGYDILFYYYNLLENAEHRAEQFLKESI